MIRCAPLLGMLLALAVPAARGEISLVWQPVPVTATTDPETPPPGIAGYECWDLLATITPGDDFASMKMLWNPAAPIFQHKRGDNSLLNAGPPDPTLFGTYPVLPFDSYVRGPGGRMVLLDDYFPDKLPGNPMFDSNQISIAAGDLAVNTSGGTFQLVRVTFDPSSGDSPFHAIGRVWSLQNPDEGFPFPVPEPRPLLVLMIGMIGFALYRSRVRARPVAARRVLSLSPGMRRVGI